MIALRELRSPLLFVLELAVFLIMGATIVGQCHGGRRQRELNARLSAGLTAAADTIDAAERAIAQRDTVLAQLQDSADALAALRTTTQAAARRATTTITTVAAGLPDTLRRELEGAVASLGADAAACDEQRLTCEAQRVQAEQQVAIARATLGVVRDSLTMAIARADSIRPLTPLQQLWAAKEEAAVLAGGGLLIYLALKAIR